MHETVEKILEELAEMGSEATKKILVRHGAREPFYGVKVGDLKKLEKRFRNNHALALALYDTGNSDAMYLAGLISDPGQMNEEQLNHWVSKAYWYMLSEYTVAWVAAESTIGLKMALAWINSKEEHIASAGWATLNSWLSTTPNEQIDMAMLHSLMERIEKAIHQSPNRVRYTMNGFVIAVGCYVPVLKEVAIKLGERIGKVSVNMGETSCKVPDSPSYILKVESMGRLGKKRKSNRC